MLHQWDFLECFVMVIEVFQNEVEEFENFYFVEDV